MAVIYQADLVPSKIEVLRAWVPEQAWLGGADASALEPVGAYRFDDPAGEVGMEVHLLRAADGAILQVPLTYRGAPLEGSESTFVATMQHSVLGTRWVYDGCTDPVFVQALASTILTGGREADLEVMTDAGVVQRGSATRVVGSGTAGTVVPAVGATSVEVVGTTTSIRSESMQVIVHRVIGGAPVADGLHTLVGTWTGHDTPTLLATVGGTALR